MANTSTVNKATTNINDGVKRYKKKGQMAEVWDRLKKQPVAIVVMAVLIFIILVAIFADVIVPYEDAITQVPKLKLMKPFQDAQHFLGGDEYGRDMFARIVHGARTALVIGFGVAILATIISVVLACIGSLYGGIADMIIMRIIDVFQSIPGLVISLAVCAGLGTGMVQLILAITVGSVPMLARMVRSKALGVCSMEYIEAATALGATTPYIIIKHIVPNIVSMILINATEQVSRAVNQAATLGFIGLGIKPPTPEWGTMLSGGMQYMIRNPQMAIIPGAALVLTALCVNTLGDCLRDAFDPQLKGKA